MKNFIIKLIKIYKLDFVDFTTKKVIEFNGDFWHCNPINYNENYYNKLIKSTSKEIWQKDMIKNNFIISKGYEILVIWENEYRKNKEKVIKQCIDYIIKV